MVKVINPYNLPRLLRQWREFLKQQDLSDVAIEDEPLTFDILRGEFCLKHGHSLRVYEQMDADPWWDFFVEEYFKQLDERRAVKVNQNTPTD